MHWRTEESLVAAHFNHAAHSVGDMAAMVIDLITHPGPHFTKDKGKQMDQGSEDRIPSGNEPQSQQPLNLLPSGDLRIL